MPTTPSTTSLPTRNEVFLTGRVSGVPEARELPSGDQMVTWRLVVDRPPPRAGERRGPTVDTIDCSAWLAAVRRSALTWQTGDVVEVEGALRRRFWQTGGGPASRTEVEVVRARRASVSPRRSRAAPGLSAASA